MRRLKMRTNSSSPVDDAAMFDRGFLQENSEFFRLDPNQNFSLVIMHLDIVTERVNVTRVGKDLKNLNIRSELSANPFGFNGLAGLQFSSTTARPSPGSVNKSLSDEMATLIDQKQVLLKLLDLTVDKSSVSFQVRVATSKFC